MRLSECGLNLHNYQFGSHKIDRWGPTAITSIHIQIGQGNFRRLCSYQPIYVACLEDPRDSPFILHHLEYETPPGSRIPLVCVLSERAFELTWRIRDRECAVKSYHGTKLRSTKVTQHPPRARTKIELAENTWRVYLWRVSRKIRGREYTTEDPDCRDRSRGYRLSFAKCLRR